MHTLLNPLNRGERYRALGATVRKVARYRLGTGQPTWQNLQKAKFSRNPLRADIRRSLREALCDEKTELGSLRRPIVSPIVLAKKRGDRLFFACGKTGV